MKAAHEPRQRPASAKLLIVRADGQLEHAPRAALADFFCAGDVLIANDAATLPASLHGFHEKTGQALEIRLAGRRSLAYEDLYDFQAIVFGAGDHRIRTEDRPPPVALKAGDRLILGPLVAQVRDHLDHERLISLAFEGTPEAIWKGLAQHGRPVQYAHMRPQLELYDVWTKVAMKPVAFEPPSAGFVLDWGLVGHLRRHGIDFATLTHAAGLSSTGDPELDARLPFDEAYHLPASTVRAIERARRQGGRIIALGTTVARALEHAASSGEGLEPGPGIATGRIGAQTRPQVVDVILTGTHEPGESHYELLKAFSTQESLAKASLDLASHGYRTHEFGDSMLVESAFRAAAAAPCSTPRRSAA